ncbi:hypothetical protein B0J18DRAFT_440695 [Chaetomium sp. MPI-SDFR-AT-0129]|nr:hypothetical protein B0J18DRAFT_440695 [Chaetomium sp. MPI-SDFR-AT-0129]
MNRNTSVSPGGPPRLRVSRTAAEGQVPIDDQSQVDQVTNIIHRALLLLESPQGREVLRHIGRDVIMNATGIEPLYPRSDRNFALMGKYVDQFLQSMRADFPDVVLEVMLGVEAEFSRWDWRTGPETKLEDFDPRRSGYLLLDLDILTHLFKTPDMDERMTTVFFMIFFVSHEIVHCFVGFITGHGLVETPDSVGAGGHPGESGYRWEADFFGGFVTMYGLPERGIQQAGIPYFFLEHAKKARGHIVCPKYIEQFVTGDGTIRLPVEFSEESREVTMEDLDKHRKSMPKIRGESVPAPGSSRASSRRSSRSGSNSRPHSQAPTYQTTASLRGLGAPAGPHRPTAGAGRTAPLVRSDPRISVSSNNNHNNNRPPQVADRKQSGPPQRPGTPALTRLAIPTHEQRPVANPGHSRTASLRTGLTPTTQRRQSPATASTGSAVTPTTQRRLSPPGAGSGGTPTTQRRQSPATPNTGPGATPTQRLVMRPATPRPPLEGPRK